MTALGLDEGLLHRLRDAGARVAWRRATAGPAARRATSIQVARLGDEEARVEIRERTGGATIEATAGPVGALTVLLEADRRGLPTALGSRNARPAAGFPGGSIVASWGAPLADVDARPTLRDLVELARYAFS